MDKDARLRAQLPPADAVDAEAESEETVDDAEPEARPSQPASACPACGAANPEKKWLCPSCGALTAALEEGEPVAEIDRHEELPPGGYSTVDFVSGEGLPGARKFHKNFPLEEGRNWKRLHECAAGALDGSMTDEVYQAKLNETIQIADTGAKLFQADVVKARLQSASEQNLALAEETAACSAKILTACQEMLKWLSSRDAADIHRGLALAVEAFKALDNIREVAFEAANDEWEAHEAADAVASEAAPPPSA